MKWIKEHIIYHFLEISFIMLIFLVIVSIYMKCLLLSDHIIIDFFRYRFLTWASFFFISVSFIIIEHYHESN
jgi:hypothetical protein